METALSALRQTRTTSTGLNDRHGRGRKHRGPFLTLKPERVARPAGILRARLRRPNARRRLKEAVVADL